MAPALFDPELGDRLRPTWSTAARSSYWGPPVVAGDEITTEVEVEDVGERGGAAVLRVRDALDQPATASSVCTGTWTNVVRGASRSGRCSPS